MGLDQYAFATKGENKIELMYWRKHANLEGWMANLYAQRGGRGDFNCVELQLFKNDLVSLKRDCDNLEVASGFFWGQSTDEDAHSTRDFIDSALAYIDMGYTITYTSWW